MLDDKFPDHIGWRLWRASQDWQRSFVACMQAAGHGWFTEARAGLLGHVAPSGTAQNRLVERMAISKQAVQQLVDGLVAEEIIERIADPADGRGRIVRLTERGRSAMADANRIKNEIEAAHIQKMGRRDFDHLLRLLDQLQKS